MNVLDIGIILILIMSSIIGFKRGVIKEVVSLVGLISIFVIAYIFKEELGNSLCKYLPFFNFTGSLKGLISINILIYQLIAFLIIYSILLSIYMIILKLSGILQKLVNLTVILLLPSKLGGAIISFFKVYITIFIVLLVLIIPLKDNSLFTTSKISSIVIYKTPILSKCTDSITKSVDEIYTLADKVSHKEITTNEANLQIIDIMLEYQVVDKKTIEQLVVLEKLDEIKGINAITKKY